MARARFRLVYTELAQVRHVDDRHRVGDMPAAPGSAQTLRADRLVMVDRPSTPERLTPAAAETLMGLVTSRTLVHDGDEALASQMRNVLARPLPKGWALDAAIDPRSNQPRPIVAAQAAILAVHRAMTAPRPPRRRCGSERPGGEDATRVMRSQPTLAVAAPRPP